MMKPFLFAAILFGNSLFPIMYNWNVDSDGDWTTPGNWDVGVNYPGGNGSCCDVANFPNITSAPRTITLDMDIIDCASIQFSSDQNYVLTGAHTFNYTPFPNFLSNTSGTADNLVDFMSITLPGNTLFTNNAAAGTTLTIHSPISETMAGASLSKGGGSGAVVLAGTNTYTGGTTIAGGGPTGFLSVSTGANLADGTGGGLTINSNGVLHIEGSNFEYHDPIRLNWVGFSTQTIEVATNNANAGIHGVISGNNPNSGLTKTGAGILSLFGNNTYTFNTDIVEGNLAVEGSLQSALTTVHANAILTGSGSLQAVQVQAMGLIAPSLQFAPGPPFLTVSSLVLDPAAATIMQFVPSNASTLEVTGVAMIDGTLIVFQHPGTYPSSGQFELVHAGSISGSYSQTIFHALPGFTFSLEQTPTSIFLHFMTSVPPPVNRTIDIAGLNGNAAIFANYLNHSAPNSEATLALAKLSGQTLKDALNSASPARNAFGTFISQNILFGLSQLVSSHLVDQRFFHTQRYQQPSVASLFEDMDSTKLTADCCDSWAMVPDPCDKYSFWMDGFGDYSHLKSEDQNPSFNAYSGAAMIGFDFYGKDRNLFGIGAGYAYTHLIENHNAGHQKINYYFANFYDTLYFPRGYIEFGAWGVYNQIHNYRNISLPGFNATASATIRSWQLVPHLGFGFNGSFCWGRIEPFAQFDCAIAWQKSYTEHGAGPFNMSQKSQTSEFLRSEAGLRFYESKETCWGAWMIMEKISYVNLKTFNTGRVSAAIFGTSSSFTLESFRGVQNLGSAGLEFLWRFGHRKPVTLSLAYNGEMGSKYMSHEGMIRVMKDF